MSNALITPTRDDASLTRVVHIVYGLHALGLCIGALGAATVLGSFLFGWPSIIAVALNYWFRGEARGTWLESHFRWQIRTFWFALVWAAAVWMVSVPLMFVVVGFGTLALGMIALSLWAIYRVARGWMRLNDAQPMPLP